MEPDHAPYRQCAQQNGNIARNIGVNGRDNIAYLLKRHQRSNIQLDFCAANFLTSE